MRNLRFTHQEVRQDDSLEVTNVPPSITKDQNWRMGKDNSYFSGVFEAENQRAVGMFQRSCGIWRYHGLKMK